MNLDILIFQQINGLTGRWTCLDALGVFFAAYFWYFLVGLAILIFWKKWRIIFSVFTSIILTEALVESMKFLWQRPRPFAENNINLLLGRLGGFSFPSGHAATTFALSFIVYHYNKKAGVVFFFASFLISIARVFVGVHWPSDVLGGAIVGIFSGWLVIKLSKRF